MICNVRTLGISGIQGNVVSAECYISSGLPAFDIVGLPDASVKEARERVRAAAKSSGLKFPVSRITVNLAPANLKKAGTHYDLPILLSILSAAGEIRRPAADCAFLGELSLDGEIRAVSGPGCQGKRLPLPVCPGGERRRSHSGPGTGNHSGAQRSGAGRWAERPE